MIYLIDGEVLNVPTLQAYWNDPQPFEEERARRLAIFNAAMAAHDARVRAERERRWAFEKECG